MFRLGRSLSVSRLQAGWFLARVVAASRPACSLSTLSGEDLYRRRASQPRLITTPIFYVNAKPHIGHLYSALLADALARWYRLRGDVPVLVTGTDEHGSKVAEAAERNGKSPQLFCDEVSQSFRQLFDEAGITYDKFIRTTSADHSKTVRWFWERIESRGFIKKGYHEGWYSVPDEAFLTATQVGDGTDNQGQDCKVSLESGHPVAWLREENYKFDLPLFRDRLLGYLSDGGRSRVHPRSRLNEVLSVVNGGLLDVSVSRRAQSVEWGLSVPADEQHTVYVWFDALTNYLTAVDAATALGVDGLETAGWPPAHQIIGKDILRFHAIYWPAFLMAADLPLPLNIHAHAHWTVDKRKMSKSVGNVVCPTEIIRQHGLDPVRYFLLADGGITDDGDYSVEALTSRRDNDLADTFGNLVSRCTSKSMLKDGLLPVAGPLTPDDEQLLGKLDGLLAVVDGHNTDLEFAKSLTAIMALLHEANRYFTANEPWSLKKVDPARCDAVLHVTLECIRVSSLLLQNVLPGSMDRVLSHIGVPESERDVRFMQARRQHCEPRRSVESARFVLVEKSNAK